jgi:hypothetical protein
MGKSAFSAEEEEEEEEGEEEEEEEEEELCPFLEEEEEDNDAAEPAVDSGRRSVRLSRGSMRSTDWRTSALGERSFRSTGGR